MTIRTLAIVGVGLIGGSLGLAARRHGLARHVLGVGRQQASLDRALAVGAIDEPCLHLPDAARRSDLVVFCTPVTLIVSQVLEAAPHCPPGALLTDAGSTKAAIVRALEGRLPPGVAFIGSHPLAGSEKRGPEHARADLFQGRTVVLTPTDRDPPDALARLTSFWEALGSRVCLLSPEEHDRALALTSHLPHLAAAALAGLLPPELASLTATGFRDTTRVAAGDPSLWTGIFQHNHAALLDALARLTERLDDFRRALQRDDAAALDSLLTQAKTVRDALGN